MLVLNPIIQQQKLPPGFSELSINKLNTSHIYIYTHIQMPVTGQFSSQRLTSVVKQMLAAVLTTLLAAVLVVTLEARVTAIFI